MARTKASENLKDPATGRNLPSGVVYRGPHQYRARKLVDGVRVARTLETAEMARAWLEKTSVAVRDGVHVDRSSLDKSTLGDLIDEFVAKMMQDDGERRGAAEDRRGHIPALKNDPIAKLKLSKVTSAAVLAFRDRQKLTYAPETVVKRLNMLARIFNVAIGEWKMPIPTNPASAGNVPRPSLEGEYRDRRLMEPTEAEIKAAAAAGEDPPEKEETRLLKAAGKSMYPDDKSLFQLAIAQAMRQGEMFNLRYEDIDFEGKVITVRGRAGLGPKNAAKASTIRVSKKFRRPRTWERRPLMPEAIEILKEVLADRSLGPLDFVFRLGTADALSTRVGRIISRAGLVDLTFHDLRHEATSRLSLRYRNPSDLKRVTGHKDLKSLDRYYHPDLKTLAEQDDRLAA